MAPTPDPTFAALESLITNSHPSHADAATIITDIGSPSASIAVLDHGSLSSHMISTLPSYDVDTLYQAASISKPAAGLCIARLIEKGAFELDSRVVDLLPKDVLDDMTADVRTREAMESVTVKMLMSHSAGLSVHGFIGYAVELYPDEEHGLPSVKEVVKNSPGVNSGKVKIVAPPGLEFMYSGGGITVLQIIVEHVTGKGFGEVMKEEVFGPLGMDRSCYVLEEKEKNFAETWWTGVTKCETKYHIIHELAAGGMWTTPADLLKLARAVQEILRGGSDESVPGGFLSKEFAQKILTTVKFTMGLTWFCNDHAMGHGGGNWPGYRCMMFGYADLPWNKKSQKETKGESKTETISNIQIDIPEGCGISVMTNAATGQEVVWKLIHAIAYLKGWPVPPAFFSEPEKGSPFGVNGDVESGKNQDWKQWTGEWTDKGGKYSWMITEGEDGKPRASAESGVMMTLRSAAISPLKYLGGKQSIDLVLDGTEMMLRLGWERGAEEGQQAKQTVEMCHHALSTTTVLYKAQ